MIKLLHGDNQLESRNELNRLISGAESKELIRLDGEKTSLNEIVQALESSSLFGMEKLVIIENLFSRRQSKEKKEIIDW
jgi:DNA polymerase III, delta subunit.